MTADDPPIARRGPFAAGTNALLFVLISCRVVLSMGVTGIIEHYIAESQFTAVVLLKTEKECGIKIVKIPIADLTMFL